MTDQHPFPLRPAPGPQFPTMTLFEVLSWIGLGQPHTFEN